MGRRPTHVGSRPKRKSKQKPRYKPVAGNYIAAGVEVDRVHKAKGSRMSAIRAGSTLSGARLEALAFLSARRLTRELVVLGIFIEHYEEREMRRTGDGRILCALLHTCTYTRYRAALLFEPIRMREVAAPPPDKQHVLSEDPRLVDYMLAILPSFFVDWSIERYETRSRNVKACKDALRTESGLRGRDTECTVYIMLDTLPLGKGRREVKQDWPSTSVTMHGEHSRRFATVQEGCEVLQAALEDAWDSRFDETITDWTWPNAPFLRFASPHHRARMGSLDAPLTGGASIRVEYWLYYLENEVNADVMGNKSWLFQTIKAGDADE